MFTESLLDDSAGRGQRGWSTFIAWLCQTCLIALAILLPLWQTNALPRVVGVFTPIGPPPAARPPRSENAVARTVSHHPSVVSESGFTTPREIPRSIDMKPDARRDATEDPGPPCTTCVLNSTGDMNNAGTRALANLLPPEPARPAPPPKPASRVVISAGVQQGFLVHQVQPSYPAIARAARVEGTVVLAAVINRDGTIQGLHAMSGPPMLIGAAIDAVRQWRYRPYMLNNQPVEVETQISVIFTLSH